jgi:hypothetical protein
LCATARSGCATTRFGSFDAFQQDARRFVARVLRHELALEGPLQDRLPQPLGALEIGLNDGFQFVNNRQTLLDLSDNAVLFRERRERKAERGQLRREHMLY